MPSKKRYPAIKYTSRDFNSIKSDLVNYAKRYYPNTYKDFSESGFGSLMLDTTAYIGDILSFYLDYSVNESFLDTAFEYNNILKLGRQMGYRFNPNPASFGTADFYIVVPAATIGVGPDDAYIPILRRGSRLTTLDGLAFLLNEDVNFANPSNEIVVARADEDTGSPTHYAIKASGQVVSGRTQTEDINVEDFQKFPRLRLEGKNITEILSVQDGEGNMYFEVDYLTQDVIYRSTVNRGSNTKTVQETLRPFAVPRRFTVERPTPTDIFLQFGFGSEIDDTNINPAIDPSMVVIKQHAKDYTSDVSFDPSNFLGTDKMGIAPANTTLTVRYRVNDANNVNVTSNSLTNLDAPLLDFDDPSVLDNAKANDVIESLDVSNDQPIVGDVTLPTGEELKHRIYNVFASQNRAVTIQDYKALCYSMPPQFGAVKRVNIVKDPGSFRRNLNLYVISEDDIGLLEKTNDAIKNNLKFWIDQGRMINDTIDIMDAKIINLGIEFTAISTLDSNKYDVFNSAVSTLSQIYSNKKFEIGEPFYVTNIYNDLNELPGVVDVSRVKITRQEGEKYSEHFYDIDANFSDDGRYIKCPQNVIFEVKFPTLDVKGTIK